MTRTYRAKPQGNSAAVVLIVAGMLALVGVGALILYQRNTVPSDVYASLTSDQQTAWNRVRRDYQGTHVIFAYFSTRNRWLAQGGSDWHSGLPRISASGDYSNEPWSQTPAEALASAKNELSPDIVAKVIVDISTGENPKIIKWFYDDGKSLKSSATAPTVKLHDTLTSHFADLQRNPTKG